MKKIQIILIAIFTLTSSAAFAAAYLRILPLDSPYVVYGTPTQMEFDVQSMQMCEDFNPATGICTGSNDYTFNKTMTGGCDIAATASANTNACSYSNTSAGITKNIGYKYMRVTMSNTINLNASVTATTAANIGSGINEITAGNRTCSTRTGSNTSIYFATAAVSSTSSSQAFTLPQGPGNDTFVNNITDPTNLPNTTLGGSDVNLNIKFFDDLGLQKGTHYTFTNNYSTPIAPLIWQSGINADASTFTTIYRLNETYTKTTDVNPTVKMTFDVTNAVAANWMKYNDSSDNLTYSCAVFIERPLVTFTVE